ncbi:hypothetical protein [Microlunatus sp. Y2014]|uniref:hypothetical protein n=1 Tax=Microlunatus sp. Y2014 TaxID=3418488 RepID=UPI003DA6DF3B
MREYAAAVGPEDLAAQFADPPRRFGPVGFWFLNDGCDPDELDRQLEEFAAAGFGGISPCARIGLDPAVGYLTDRWFAVLDRVMAQCRRLGLQVILYDEASYPSGSANGAVVAANPYHAARGLVLGAQVVTQDGVITGSGGTAPATVTSPPTGRAGFWRPTTGRSLVDRLVAVVAGRLDDQGRVLVDTLQLLPTGEHDLVRLDPADLPGKWRLLAVFDVPSGGTIRGAYAHNDDGSALAPAAANLLDPEAVASFIHLTHDAYATHLGSWFGDPIVGMFTDEPHLLGRSHRADARPWTPELLTDLTERPDRPMSTEDVLIMLPSLFVPYDDDRGFGAHFTATVADRLSRVYYGAQRRWCDDHGIALTGHPSAPDEMSPLDSFSWPGQDAVWRWVLPGETALHGPESAGARTAASAALTRGVRTVLTELFGAYGWGLTMDEVKWLLDWHLVRGTTTFLFHALFSSVRGHRAFESEPDLALHNAWWPHLPAVLRYVNRASMVTSSLQPVVDVGVVVTGDRAPTVEVADLYRHQVTFSYLTPDDLATAVVDEAGSPTAAAAAAVRVAGQRCRAILGAREAAALPGWADLAAAGATMITFADGAPQLPAAVLAELRRDDVEVVSGPAADLRVARWVTPAGPGVEPSPDAAEWVLVVNEGEAELLLHPRHPVEVWDCFTGRRWHPDATVRLPRRASLLLAPAGGTDLPPEPTVGPLPGGPLALTGWSARTADGGSWPAPALGDWTEVDELATWHGTIVLHCSVHLTAAPATAVVLDLGRVGELARVEVNGRVVAELLWAPHRAIVPAGLLQRGDNVIEVAVTNSSANHYEGALRPSGLLGPVTLG